MRLTWWGHATVTLELGGVRLLTDPVLSARVGHLYRARGPKPRSEARNSTAVLVSHMHLDHLHLPSVRVAGGPVIAPAGAELLLPGAITMHAGRQIKLGAVSVEAVPAKHDGRRRPGSKHAGPALGYLISHRSQRVWFAGDTGLFDEMSAIGPVDIAIVPIGGWGPTLGPDHLNPEQAAEAVRRVGARVAIPVHYGTFWPIGLPHLRPARLRELFHEPADRFAAACEVARIVAHGETVTL